MKRSPYFITGLLIPGILIFLLTSCVKPDENKNQSSIPAAAIKGKVEGELVRFHISIPERFHAYLDSGKEGRLIPISFDWKNALKETRSPDIKSAPGGNFDADFGAKVLRGEGEFIFQMNRAAEDLIGKTVKVKTQLCDDVKGICYRPTVEDVVIN